MRSRMVILLILEMLMGSVVAQSDLYRRYASRTDLTVAELRKFHVNDTLDVDITMIMVPDISDWEHFLREMNVNQMTIDNGMQSLEEDNPFGVMFFCKRYHPEIHPVPAGEVGGTVFIDFLTLTLYYINVDSIQQGFVFTNYKISSLKEYIKELSEHKELSSPGQN